MFFGVGAVGRQSIVGKRGVQGASLDLGFMSPGVLDPRITFTRASTATYFDATGTMQTATTNAPRWDYNPTTRGLNGLLIEESRQNLMLQSQFGGASWPPTASVLTANAATSPDGGATAATLREDNTTAAHFVGQTVAKAASAITYAFTLFIKQGSGTRNLKIEVDDAGTNGVYCIINPSTGAVVIDTTLIGAAWTFTPAVVTSLPNGWWRVTFMATSNTIASVRILLLLMNGITQNYAGDNTSNIQIYGCQLETGAFPTSYIPTTTVAVTRAQDVMSMPTSTWFNATTGTVQAECLHPVLAASNNQQTMVSLNDNTTQNRLEAVRTSTSNTIAGFIAIAGSTTYFANTGVMVPGSPVKAAMAYTASTQRTAVNGAILASVGASTLPAMTTLAIGAVPGGFNILNGYVRRVRYWSRALSAAELASVTT